METELEILPEAKESVDRRNGETTWDADLGFLLYSVGLTCPEIARRFSISPRTVLHRAHKDGWDDKKAVALTERAKRVGVDASKEQEFIRSQECHFARQLMGVAEQMLRTIDTSKGSMTELTKVLDLASRLGRLGSGLPMVPMELNVSHDLSDELKAQLERIYAEPAPRLATPEKSEAIEAQVIEQKPSDIPG